MFSSSPASSVARWFPSTIANAALSCRLLHFVWFPDRASDLVLELPPPLLAADNFPNKFSLDKFCQFLIEDKLIKERHIHLLIARHFDFVSQFDMDENHFVI